MICNIHARFEFTCLDCNNSANFYFVMVGALGNTPSETVTNYVNFLSEKQGADGDADLHMIRQLLDSDPVKTAVAIYSYAFERVRAQYLKERKKDDV